MDVYKNGLYQKAKEMWDTLTITYEDSLEKRPQTTIPITLKSNETTEEQSKDKEANLCLMDDTPTEESESELEQEDEADFDNLESLKQVYHELLSNFSILSKAYNYLRKNFKKFSKDHTKFQKKHNAKVNHSLKKKNPQVFDVYENPEIQRTIIYLENERISKDKDVLLQNFLDLENQLGSLQKI